MPYRRLDLVASDLSLDAARDLIEDDRIIDSYRVATENGRDRVSLVVDDMVTEETINDIKAHFENDEKFRLYIYPIAAVWPREEEAELKQRRKNASLLSRDRISKDELLDDLDPGSRVTTIYLVQVVISCLVAASGMILDDVAMVIAAMVIAPLLIPNMSLALGTTLGDLAMVRRSAFTAAVGLVVGLLVAIGIGLVFEFDPTVNQIAGRSQITLAHVVVAASAGAAGAIAVTTGVSAAMVGVMVAVALVPPLVAVGLLLGAGEYAAASAAGLMLVTNIVCVNLAAVVVMLLQGILPSRWYEADRAKRAIWVALVMWTTLTLILAGLIWYAGDGLSLKSR